MCDSELVSADANTINNSIVHGADTSSQYADDFDDMDFDNDTYDAGGGALARDLFNEINDMRLSEDMFTELHTVPLTKRQR